MELNKEALDEAARVNSGYPSERWYEGGTMFRAQMRNNVRPVIEAYLNALPTPAVETPVTPEPVHELISESERQYLSFMRGHMPNCLEVKQANRIEALQAEIELLDDLVYKSAYKASKLTRESVTLRNEVIDECAEIAKANAHEDCDVAEAIEIELRALKTNGDD